MADKVSSEPKLPIAEKSGRNTGRNTGRKTGPSFRFRLWHLFSLLTLFAVGFWYANEIGKVDCEIQIDELDVFEDGPDLSRSSFPCVTSLTFSYVRPQHLTNYRVRIILDEQVFGEQVFEVGDRIEFRYREYSLFGLKQDSPQDVALRLLGIQQSQIEELIAEKVW